MAIYGVVMDEAVFMSSLGDNALATGYKTGHCLYSCSAIILTNAQKGAAALYHYPSGGIYDDDASRKLIDFLIDDVRPTAVHITYGATDFGTNDSWMSVVKELNEKDEPSETPKKAKVKASKETVELKEYLQGLLGGLSISKSPAQKGSALVRIVSGKVEYSKIEDGTSVKDLGDFLPGKYPDQGFKIYWRRQYI